MAVTIDFQYYEGIPQVLNKNPRSLLTVRGTFRKDYSLMNPTIDVEGEHIVQAFNEGTVNYVRIDDKYYYVIDWSVFPNNLITVYLHLDVLMTYRTEISNTRVTLERSSSSPTGEGFDDIPDPNHPLASRKITEKVEFPRGFSELEEDGTYVLVTSQAYYAGVGDGGSVDDGSDGSGGATGDGGGDGSGGGGGGGDR